MMCIGRFAQGSNVFGFRATSTFDVQKPIDSLCGMPALRRSIVPIRLLVVPP